MNIFSLWAIFAPVLVIPLLLSGHTIAAWMVLATQVIALAIYIEGIL